MSPSARVDDPAASSDRAFLHSEIASRAVDNWRQDGHPRGRDHTDWLRAEAELAALLKLCTRNVGSMRQQQTAGLLHSVLDNAPVVISVQDPDGTYLFVNRRFESVHGVSRESVVGRSEADVRLLPFASPSAPLPRRVVDSETPLQIEECIPRADGVHTYLTVKFAVADGGGSSKTVCSISTDISDRKEVERRLKLLHGVNALLAASASLGDLAQPVLEMICSAYEWDAAAFWQIASGTKPLQCLATWCVPDDDLREFCRVSSQLRFDIDVALPGKVWREGAPEWVSDIENEPGLVRRSAALQGRLSTAFACPIQAQEQIVGVMEFYSRSKRKPPAGLQETMASIGSQIGQFALHRAAARSLLLRNHELALARRIQVGWQPRESPMVPGYDIAGASLPAHEVGGDYFDFFSMSDQRIGIAIGDATGHGLDSALQIAEVRAYVRALAAAENCLEKTFSLVNRHFIEHAEEGCFVTLLLARLDPATGELTYNNAGHLSGHVFDASGALRQTMPSTSFPLGVISGVPFPPGPSLQLNPGDWVLLFTDGIIDAREKDGEPLGTERFLRLARELCPGRCAREAIHTLIGRVAEFAGHEFDDDMTAVLIARNSREWKVESGKRRVKA